MNTYHLMIVQCDLLLQLNFFIDLALLENLFIQIIIILSFELAGFISLFDLLFAILAVCINTIILIFTSRLFNILIWDLPVFIDWQLVILIFLDLCHFRDFALVFTVL